MRSILTIFLALVLGLTEARAQARFDYFYQEAVKCCLTDDYSSAIDLFRHALDINPDAPEALYQMGLIHLGLRQDSIGGVMIRQATERDPENPYYLEALAAFLLNRQRNDEAIPVLEKMASLRTRRSDILAQLSSLYKNSGETGKAIGVLNRIEQLEGINPRVSVEKFKLYLDKEERDSAFMQMQMLCDEMPHDMNLRVLVGSQYMNAGDTVQALAAYDEVRRTDPANTNLQLAMMDYYRESGQQERYDRMRDSLISCPTSPVQLQTLLLKSYMADEARDSTVTPKLMAAFDALLSVPQQGTDLLIMKAAYLMMKQQPQDAICATMRDILEVDPGNQVALSELLKYYISQDDDKGVEDICRRGLNYHPEEISYAYYLGMALAEQKKLPEAAEAIQQGIRVRTEDVHPQLLSNVFATLGDIYFQQGLELEAFAAYDSSLVYHPDNVLCLNNYAYYLSLKGENLDQAEEMSYRSLRLDPDNPTYLDTYAWILFMKEDYAGARSYMNKVLNPSRSDAELLDDAGLSGVIIEHSADIHVLCGDMGMALRLWRLALLKDDGTCSPHLRKKLKKKRYIK